MSDAVLVKILYSNSKATKKGSEERLLIAGQRFDSEELLQVTISNWRHDYTHISRA
jgi:hypothetical protein